MMLEQTTQSATKGSEAQGQTSTSVRSTVAYSDPRMIMVSLYEIKDILTTGLWASIVMAVGAAWVSGVVSAWCTRVVVPWWSTALAFFLFVTGVGLHVWTVAGKYRSLSAKGRESWSQS